MDGAVLRRDVHTLREHLAPEVSLLLRARAAAEGRSRPKDDADLARALPGLALDARRWLRQALEVAEAGHPWLSRLN